jgi:hypothetical protein
LRRTDLLQRLHSAVFGVQHQHVHCATTGRTIVVAVCADEQVAAAISVDIPQCRHGDTKEVARYERPNGQPAVAIANLQKIGHVKRRPVQPQQPHCPRITGAVIVKECAHR